jgi:conjugative transfer signal peptidase TraF
MLLEHGQAISASSKRIAQWWLGELQEVLVLLWRARWPFAAFALLLFYLSERWEWTVNVTPSLPYRLVIIDKKADTFNRGDLVVFDLGKSVGRLTPDLRLFKIMAGIPGDHVVVEGRNVSLRHADETVEHVGHAYRATQLEPIEAGEIPPGYFYARGTHESSLDSRYRAIGLVKRSAIRGRVYPVF